MSNILKSSASSGSQIVVLRLIGGQGRYFMGVSQTKFAIADYLYVVII
jgi:hypothetical protein